MNKHHLKLLLIALAAGDALGSTSEFEELDPMPALYQRVKAKGWPFRQVGGGAFHWKAGEATDDTAMAMCIVRSFMRNGRVDGADVAKEFVRWLETSPPDVGHATRRGLTVVRTAIAPWYEGGFPEYEYNNRSAANGSLMRNGVIAGLANSMEEGFRFSLHHGLPTHFGPLPVICCCAQTYLLMRLLEGSNPFNGDWVRQFERAFASWLEIDRDEVLAGWIDGVGPHLDEAMEEFCGADFNADSFDPFVEFDGADGYCLLTLQIGVWAATWSGRGRALPTPEGFPREVFERAVGPGFLAAVAMIGRDADTYGAVAGPLIAAVHGQVPQTLVEGLEAIREMKRLGIWD